jgi:hypothetical protein
MTSRLRKLALLAHITTSVGWIGAVVPYLSLAITGLISKDVQTARAAYYSMALIGWYVLVPLSLAALISGLVQSLGTRWGLIRHWWVVAKFLMTLVAAAVLLKHMQLVSRMAQIAAEKSFSSIDFRMMRIQLVIHPAGGLLILLAVTAISVFKPWGMTPYGQRTVSQTNLRPQRRGQLTLPRGQVHGREMPSWSRVVGIHLIGVALLLAVVLHLTHGGIWTH